MELSEEPAWPCRRVLDLDADLGELVADLVRFGEVLRGTSFFALPQQEFDERADDLDDVLFNLGMGRQYSADDVATAIEAAVPGAQTKVSFQMPESAMFKLSSGAASGAVMNIDRARRQLGFEPEFPMAAAIRDYVAWLQACDKS